MSRAAVGLLALYALAGCGVGGPNGGLPAAAPSTLAPSPSAAALTAAATTEANTMPSQPTNEGGATSAPAQALSAQQTEALARSDLAAFLKVAPDQIELVSAAERTWPDKGLGCAAQKGFYEPQQIPGYEIILSHAGATYRYHADRQGSLMRCSNPGKPLGPISR